jgi:UDP-galactopyranose mutase
LTIDKYKKEASKLKNVYFAGRLAECKYYNMDQAVKRALELTRNL